MRRQGSRDPHDPRVRVEAARTVVDALPPSSQDAAEMASFMEIFHPGHPATDELVRDARERGRRR